jgi:hypothetical protein
VPGGDVNQYLAVAALIAAGLHGIENKLELEPITTGNAYSGGAPRVPSSLRHAAELFSESKITRAAFGDDVVEHYLNNARIELAAFDSAVLISTVHSGYGSDHGNVGEGLILLNTIDTVIADIIIDNAKSATTPGNAPATFSAGWAEDETSGETKMNPTWNVGPLEGSGHPEYVRTHRAQAGGSGAYDTIATFTPTITRAGTYQVYEWHSYSGINAGQRTESNTVPHVITYSGGIDTVIVDQEANVGQWNLIGTKSFAIGTTGKVVIANNGGTYTNPGGEWVMADAIKFVYVRP